MSSDRDKIFDEIKIISRNMNKLLDAKTNASKIATLLSFKEAEYHKIEIAKFHIKHLSEFVKRAQKRSNNLLFSKHPEYKDLKYDQLTAGNFLENMKELSHSDFENTTTKVFMSIAVYDMLNSYAEALYNPMLISNISMLEKQLKDVCDTYASINKLKITVDDIAPKNNYIEQSRLYFKKIMEIDLEDTNKEWEQIKTFYKIRNIIIHSNASLYKNSLHNDFSSKKIKEHELFDYMVKSKSFIVNMLMGNFYVSDHKYLLKMIDVIQSYINKIYDKIIAKYE